MVGGWLEGRWGDSSELRKRQCNDSEVASGMLATYYPANGEESSREGRRREVVVYRGDCLWQEVLW